MERDYVVNTKRRISLGQILEAGYQRWLVKKNNCIGWKVGMRAEGERTGSTERMMGSDSGLSGRTGCPEECEADAEEKL